MQTDTQQFPCPSPEERQHAIDALNQHSALPLIRYLERLQAYFVHEATKYPEHAATDGDPTQCSSYLLAQAASACYHLGTLEGACGSKAKEVTYFRKAHELDPENPIYLGMLEIVQTYH